jgi:hypothetical protein
MAVCQILLSHWQLHNVGGSVLQRHEPALGQGNRVVERSFPAYAILKSRVA